jgi:hypothetical protein
MEPSTMALGLDQIPESVFPALLAAQFVTLSMHAPSRGGLSTQVWGRRKETVLGVPDDFRHVTGPRAHIRSAA